MRSGVLLGKGGEMLGGCCGFIRLYRKGVEKGVCGYVIVGVYASVKERCVY